MQLQSDAAAPRSRIRKLKEYVRNEPDDRCLEFYNTDRIVNTASYAQVRNPIYSTSVNRYRHYESHLQPLKDALAADSS